jgi:hypothetical protein
VDEKVGCVKESGWNTPWNGMVHGLKMLNMKPKSRKRSLTFGEFVAHVYDVWGERKGRGIVHLAIKAHLIEFNGDKRFVIS